MRSNSAVVRVRGKIRKSDAVSQTYINHEYLTFKENSHMSVANYRCKNAMKIIAK